LEAVFILLESPSPSRRIFIGSLSLPPLWFAVSVLQPAEGGYTRMQVGDTPKVETEAAYGQTAAVARMIRVRIEDDRQPL
jgi:hypothetical protein